MKRGGLDDSTWSNIPQEETDGMRTKAVALFTILCWLVPTGLTEDRDVSKPAHSYSETKNFFGGNGGVLVWPNRKAGLMQWMSLSDPAQKIHSFKIQDGKPFGSAEMGTLPFLCNNGSRYVYYWKPKKSWYIVELSTETTHLLAGGYPENLQVVSRDNKDYAVFKNYPSTGIWRQEIVGTSLKGAPEKVHDSKENGHMTDDLRWSMRGDANNLALYDQNNDETKHKLIERKRICHYSFAPNRGNEKDNPYMLIHNVLSHQELVVYRCPQGQGKWSKWKSFKRKGIGANELNYCRWSNRQRYVVLQGVHLVADRSKRFRDVVVLDIENAKYFELINRRRS